MDLSVPVECPWCDGDVRFEINRENWGKTVEGPCGHVLETTRGPVGVYAKSWPSEERNCRTKTAGRLDLPEEFLREEIKEAGHPEIAENDNMTRSVLGKAAQGHIREYEDGIYWLLRKRDKTPSASWCSKCGGCWKVYQSTHHIGDCPNA